MCQRLSLIILSHCLGYALSCRLEGNQALLFRAFEGHVVMIRKKKGKEIINTARMKGEEGKEFCDECFHPSVLDVQGCGSRSSILDFKSARLLHNDWIWF